MGKTKWGSNNSWNTRQAGGDSSSSAHGQWDSWEAWDAWGKPPRGAQHNPKDLAAFPKYQDMDANPASVNAGAKEMAEDTEDGQTRIPVLQKLINNIRKAEAKARKCKEMRAKRESQWSQYQEEVKKHFLGQRAEYRADLKKIDAEEEDAVQARSAAAAMLKDCINGRTPTSRQSEPAAYNKEDAQSWDELMGAIASPGGREPMDAWLQEMITATSLGGTAAISSEHRRKLQSWMEDGTPSTPPTRGTRGLPMTPAGQVPRCPSRVPSSGDRAMPEAATAYCPSSQSNAISDPYLMSPRKESNVPPSTAAAGNGGGGGKGPAGLTSVSPKTSPIRPKNGLVVPRVPLKQQAKHPPARPLGRTSSLAELVESKRSAVWTELGIGTLPAISFLSDDEDKPADESGVDNSVDLTTME